ncbi:hypothetical protein C8F04DRAFT_48654 [Mycena alexandri]|uniref:F-box domain-containing protein n=1 Tax=Mycena alexandri TaxID=1745969 RepID=A0AAD6SK54_9AGAR|nr:hypothetical protein C8F04DRAFT_48654 [Mycena alexandri]
MTTLFPEPFDQTSDLPLEHPEVIESAYPILTLPPEIVAEIFLNFLPIYPECPPLLGVLSPLALCGICRPWRGIVLSTPMLWRALEIELREYEDPKALICKLDLMDAWLLRSGNCPLSLKIHHHRAFASFSIRPSPPSLPGFHHTIVRHRRQWEHLYLVMSFRHLSIIQGDMPRLRHLTFGPNDVAVEEAPRPDLFNHAPQLDSVILTEDFVPSAISLPWTQFTRLEGLCLYEHECAEILTSVLHLVHCAMTVVGTQQNITIPIVPAHLHLQNLTLHVSDMTRVEVDLSDLLSKLTLPALRTLQLPESYMPLDPLPTLESFISRSRCSLDELLIEDASLPEVHYREALSSIGMITLNQRLIQRIAVRLPVS